MKKVFLCALFLGFFIFCQAQSFEIEKLRKQIQEYTKQDTVRVNLLIEICNQIPRIELEEVDKYATEALALSRNLGYEVGEGHALLNQARVKYDKDQNTSVEDLFQQVDGIAKKTGDMTLQYWVYLRFGGYYGNKDIRQQISWLLKAEELASQLKKKELLIGTQNSLSSLYMSLGDYTKAMDYALSALKISDELNEPEYKYTTWNNLSNIYVLIGEYEKANDYLQKLPDLHRELGFSNSQLADIYNGLGENYRLSSKLPEAIEAYSKGLSHASSATDSVVLLSNLADVYVRMDSLPMAFQYGYESLSMAKILNQKNIYGWIYGILARAHLKESSPDSALYYAKMGYQLGEEIGIMEDLRDNAQSLSEAFALKNDFKNAFSFYKSHISYRDSMMNAEVKNRSTVLEHNYEMEIKEDEITLLTEQRKLQRNFLVSALIVLGLILIAAFLLVRNIRQKQKVNRLLKQQKLEIDEKAKELSIQKDHLEKSYDNVELLGEIGRKISSSLSVDNIIGTVYKNVNGLMDAAVFGIGIYHEKNKSLDFPATYENGEALPPYSNAINDKDKLAAICFNSGNEIAISNLEEDYGNFLQSMPTPMEGKRPASLIYLPLKVKDKMFGVITVQSFSKNAFSDYHLYMLRTIGLYSAIALENAESFNQLTTTVNTLQETQKQLIQSEKMASLGELTAGIAHEIQNPLNFVNNFSEVSKEMISEIQDERSKSQEARDEILINDNLKDIQENLNKIHHHGKRADSIVKGMLAHSRSSSGEKMPTDLNALTDEYLRLSYHGLRAKDKSFNADFVTDFDPDLPRINVIPQDIGRVLLNIINNAFQACSNSEFKIQNSELKPLVTVSTTTLEGSRGIQISISDNGPGIPDLIKDKIFQPFFTTKPTGQGTGLGLSLSYDIVKAHGGEIRLESKEGEGTEFIIQLGTA